MHGGNNGNNRTGDHQGTILENGKTKTLYTLLKAGRCESAPFSTKTPTF